MKVFDLLRLEREESDSGFRPVLRVIQSSVDVTEGVGAGFERWTSN